MSGPQSRTMRARLLALVAAMFAVVGFAAPAHAADDAPVTPEAFCSAWEEATSGGNDLQLNGLSVSGSKITYRGASCDAPGASITVTNAELSENGESIGGNAAANLVAAVTHAASTNDMKNGDEVFKGAKVSGLVAVLSGDLSHVVVRGGLTVAWSGGTQTKFTFSGKLYGADRYVLQLASPSVGTSLPNIGGSPIIFSGSYERRGTLGRLLVDGSVPSLTIGSGAQQISVTNAALALRLEDDKADGTLQLGINGTIGLGDNLKATGALKAEFDTAGLTEVTGSGDLDLTVPASGNVPEITVDGGAEFSYTRDPEVRTVSFDGSVKVGDSLTAAASGTIDDAAVSFAGDVAFTNADLAIEGGADGILFYGDDLTGRTIEDASGAQVPASKGDVLIKSAGGKVTAKGLVLEGGLQYGNVGSQEWAKAAGAVDLSFQVGDQPSTEIKGAASLNWAKGSAPAVSFEGSVKSGSTEVASAKGTVDGNKLTFEGQVTLENPDLKIKGAVKGSVFYGNDLTGETIKDADGSVVPATKGDFTLESASAEVTSRGFELTGEVSIGRVGGNRFASAGGSVDLTSGATRLQGAAELDWVAGEVPAVQFEGSVISGATKLQGSGEVDGKKLRLAGTASHTGADFSVTGQVNGVVFYGTDLGGETITNKAGSQVAASKGDFLVNSAGGEIKTRGLTLAGEVTLGQVGGERWVKGGGAVDLSGNGTTLKGAAGFDWTEGQPLGLSFEGQVIASGLTASAKGSVDGKKLAFTGDADFTGGDVAVKGAVEGVVFYGSDLSGETVKNVKGESVPAAKGDYALTSASGQLTTRGLTLGGGIGFGKAGGQAWAKANGSVDLSNNGSTVKGSASVEWAQGTAAAIAFDGSVKSGGLEASAKGSIDGKKLTFTGQVNLVDGATSIKGAIDGSYYYGSDLSGETVKTRSGATVQPVKGDYVLRAASGAVKARGLDLSGAVSLGKVAGETWASGSGSVDITANGTAIKGSATFAWISGGATTVSFDGSIVNGTTKLQGQGIVDEKKIAISGSLSSPTVSGSAAGVVFHGTDLSGETITNRTGQQVGATRGDFLLTVKDGKATLGNVVATAELTASKVGATTWVKAKADLKISQSWLAFTGEIDSNGTFDLKGSGSVNFDGTWVDFTGRAKLEAGKLVIYGSGQVRTDLFAVQVSGKIEKPDLNGSTYILTGKANFKFAGFSIANGTVRIATGEGLSTNFEIKVCVLFFCSNSKVKLYFTGAKVSKAELGAPITLVAPLRLIVGGALPGVPISTKITGIL